MAGTTMKSGEIKKRRSCGPKTKTGCQTCKIRRVKCDESKPACRRCTSTGRKCDGFASRSLILTPSYQQACNFVHQMRTHIPGNAQEKRGFQFFIENTAPELKGYFESSFWGHLILQASVGEPSLRHAVIAIGCVHEQFNKDPSGVQAQYDFAMNQYTKAITHLRKSLSSGKQTPLTAVMSCILFVCFDSLRGYFDTAMVHLKSGIKILKDMRLRSKDNNLMETHLTPLLTRLILQSRFYTDTKTFIDQNKLADELNIIEPDDEGLPESFENLEQARNSLCKSSSGLFRFFYMCDWQKPMNQQGPEVWPVHEIYLFQLQEWDKKFSKFMTLKSTTLSPLEIRGAALLKIQHTTANIMAEVTPSPFDPSKFSTPLNDAENFENFGSQFQMVVNLSRSLIAAAEQDIKNKKPALTFSADLGVVGPLYYACAKCHTKSVREQALELLRRCPRREGMWDNSMVAGVVEGLWELKDRHRSLQQSIESDFGGTMTTRFHDSVDLILLDGPKWELVWKGDDMKVRQASKFWNSSVDWTTLIDGQSLYKGEFPLGGSELWNETSI